MKRLFAYLAAAAMIVIAVSCHTDEPDDPIPVIEPVSVPSGLAATDITESSLTFKWDAVKEAASYTYKLVRGMTLVKEGSVAVTNVTVDGLEPGTEYSFAVKSVTDDGRQSFYSDYIEVSTGKQSGGGLPEALADVYGAMKIPEAEEDGAARAFPGAEGGGMFTTGGRGGKILHVTSLDDTGAEGTLRWAVKQSGARVIVFDVAGIIHLKSPLKIENPDCTIAGQTAPGDGICIADRYFQVAADNVIIRFLRFRTGDLGQGAGDSDDTIWGRYCKNIVIDHCSMSWSIDECASFYANTDFTMQWCILAESLKNCSIHSKGSHGYGGIWGGGNASFHHNMLAHHDSRNPRFDHPHIYEDHYAPKHRGVVDFRNNIVYDWGSNNAYGGEGYGAGKGTGINMVANYYKPGPSSTDRKYFIDAYGVYSSCSGCGKDIDEGYPLLYMLKNVHTKHQDITEKNAEGIKWHNGDGHVNYGTVSGKAFGMDGCKVTTHIAEEAATAVCKYAGASLKRDKVDERIASDVRNGTGKIVDDTAMIEKEYGFVWPEYSATEEQLALVTDTDTDGIPDYYEALFGLNPSDASDGQAKSIDRNGRYSNFELYLHYLVSGIMEAEVEGGLYSDM